MEKWPTHQTGPHAMSTELWRCIKAHSCKKLAWQAGVGLWIAMCYYPPQWWPQRQALIVPNWFGEDTLPFMPAWAIVYQSVFLLHTAAFWIGNDMVRVRDYGISIALVFLAGAVIFWLAPTTAARPLTNNVIYCALITNIDGTRNALPSLHAAISTLGVIRFWPGSSAIMRGLLAAWWAALLFSTLATRQHRVVDLFAGILLAIVFSSRMLLNKSSQS